METHDGVLLFKFFIRSNRPIGRPENVEPRPRTRGTERNDIITYLGSGWFSDDGPRTWSSRKNVQKNHRRLAFRTRNGEWRRQFGDGIVYVSRMVLTPLPPKPMGRACRVVGMDRKTVAGTVLQCALTYGVSRSFFYDG